MSYKTIKEYAHASFVEKKSEFIGSIAPVKTNEEAIEFINRIKSENRKARHNVYAYILRDSNITRYSDDAEPQGTGGVPVLEVLRHEGLFDVCVVVTRYFGGILLGTGGLTRAYSQACKMAVDASEIMEMHKARIVTVKCDYSLYGKLNTIANDFGAKDISADFGETVSVSFMAKSDQINDIEAKIIDSTFGRCSFEVGGEIYGNFAQRTNVNNL